MLTLSISEVIKVNPPPPQKVNYLKGKVGGLKREDEINFVLLKRGLIREGGGGYRGFVKQ